MYGRFQMYMYIWCRNGSGIDVFRFLYLDVHGLDSFVRLVAFRQQC
jgi:hypothetical protein